MIGRPVLQKEHVAGRASVMPTHNFRMGSSYSSPPQSVAMSAYPRETFPTISFHCHSPPFNAAHHPSDSGALFGRHLVLSGVPRLPQHVRNLAPPGDCFSRIMSVLEDVLVTLWGAWGHPAMHSATAVRHRWRPAPAPALFERVRNQPAGRTQAAFGYCIRSRAMNSRMISTEAVYPAPSNTVELALWISMSSPALPGPLRRRDLCTR